MKSFGEQVRERRKQIGMSVVTLACKAGCSRSTIVKLERGEREEIIRKYMRIAKALDCRIDDLFPEMDEKSASAGAFDNEDMEGWER